VHRPSINTLTLLREKLSRQNAPDLMNNNSNNSVLGGALNIATASLLLLLTDACFSRTVAYVNAKCQFKYICAGLNSVSVLSATFKRSHLCCIMHIMFF